MDIRMRIFILIIFLLPLSSNCQITTAQTLKFGLSIEPSFISYERMDGSSISFVPFSANLKILAAPVNWLNFEARPGIFIGGLDYRWLELGGYTRINLLPTRIYIIAGVNDHIKGGYDDLLYNGAGIGFQKDSRLNIDVIFYWKNGVREDKLNGVLKFCFGFSWDVL